MNNVKQTRERIAKIVRSKASESNIIVSKTLIVFSVLSFIIWLLFQFGFLVSKGLLVNITLIATPILFVSISVICHIKKGKGKAFQYIFFALLSVFWLELELMSGYKSKLLLPILIVLSLRYYDKKFTIFTYFTCVIALLLSVWCNANLYLETEFIDLNTVFLEGTYDVTLNGFLFNNIIDLKPSPDILFSNGMRLFFLPNTIFLTAITILAIGFMNYNLQNILKAEELVTQEANQRVELSDMKTKIMLSQVKPHFIYNTLSSIAYFCMDDPKRAKKLTLNFSEYLRNNLDTLNSSQNSVCSFEDELEHIKCYLEIELVRFEDRLSVEYDIKVSNFHVPALSIQPIVENAVKHGISEKAKGGTVKIASEETDGYYVVTVTDDGVGFDKDKMIGNGKEHIGIANIKRRIELFGGTFSIEGTPGIGTKAIVEIPKTEELL